LTRTRIDGALADRPTRTGSRSCRTMSRTRTGSRSRTVRDGAGGFGLPVAPPACAL